MKGIRTDPWIHVDQGGNRRARRMGRRERSLRRGGVVSRVRVRESASEREGHFETDIVLRVCVFSRKDFEE